MSATRKRPPLVVARRGPKRPATTAALLLALLACKAAPPPPASGGRERPRLLVLLVADQMRADYLERLRPYFSGGFARLLGEGAVFAEASHSHAVTQTAVGHATLATGRFPAHHGIVANSWYDRELHDDVDAEEDAEEVDGPARLVGDALGDWLKRAEPGARVITASGKDRSAIMLGGRQPDAAFWYQESKGRFRSSRYYLERSPDWLAAFEARAGARTFFGRTWEALPLPPGTDSRALGLVTVDEGAFPRTFPHLVGGLEPSPTEPYFEAVYDSPWLDELLERLAEELVTRYELGADATTDLLGLSFSSLDTVGHSYGPASREALDVVLRLDLLLGRFFEVLDQRVGRRNYLVALSADHGVAPMPEATGGAARRAGLAEVLCFQKVEATLVARHGQSGWFERGLYLDLRTVAAAGLLRGEVASEVAALLSSCPGVARVLTADEVSRPAAMLADPGSPADPVRVAYARSFFPGRSPDLFVQWEEKVLAKTGRETTHSTPWSHDTHVPLIFLGSGVTPGVRARPVSTVDLAPTLAALAGIPVPAAIDGIDRSAELAAPPPPPPPPSQPPGR